MNQKPILAGLLTVFLLVASGCSKESRQTQSTQTSTSSSGNSESNRPSSANAYERDKASVRVIAAIPGSETVDVLADDKVVFPELGYKTVTQYQEISEERLTFRVRAAGPSANQTLAENSKGLAGGSHYTLVAYGGVNGKTELAAFSDNLTPPTSGKAKVRVINAAPEIGDVDVYAVGRDTLFKDLDSGSDSTYNEVDPMEVTLQIRPQGKQNALLNVEKMRFEAGGIYTIVVVGHAERLPRLTAIRIEDRIQGIPSAQLLQ